MDGPKNISSGGLTSSGSACWDSWPGHLSGSVLEDWAVRPDDGLKTKEAELILNLHPAATRASAASHRGEQHSAPMSQYEAHLNSRKVHTVEPHSMAFHAVKAETEFLVKPNSRPIILAGLEFDTGYALQLRLFDTGMQ